MKTGDVVLYRPSKGKPMEATLKTLLGNGIAELVIGTDPFPVSVNTSQIESLGCEENGKSVISTRKVRKSRPNRKETKKMSTATAEKPSAKELRKQAQGLGIKGWEEMGRSDLRKAIKKAKREQANGSAKPAKAKPKETASEDAAPKKAKSKGKSKSKTAPASKPKATKPTKAPAKKVATKAESKSEDGLTFAKAHPKETPEHGVNPFRKNSNLFRVAKLLLKGGKRETLASKLSEQTTLHPYQKGDNEVDLTDYDKRLLLGAQTMRDQYGYGILRSGRGLEGKILVFVPGGPTDPRGKGSKKGSKKR